MAYLDELALRLQNKKKLEIISVFFLVYLETML